MTAFYRPGIPRPAARFHDDYLPDTADYMWRCIKGQVHYSRKGLEEHLKACTPPIEPNPGRDKKVAKSYLKALKDSAPLVGVDKSAVEKLVRVIDKETRQSKVRRHIHTQQNTFRNISGIVLNHGTASGGANFQVQGAGVPVDRIPGLHPLPSWVPPAGMAGPQVASFPPGAFNPSSFQPGGGQPAEDDLWFEFDEDDDEDSGDEYEGEPPPPGTEAPPKARAARQSVADAVRPNAPGTSHPHPTTPRHLSLHRGRPIPHHTPGGRTPLAPQDTNLMSPPLRERLPPRVDKPTQTTPQQAIFAPSPGMLVQQNPLYSPARTASDAASRAPPPVARFHHPSAGLMQRQVSTSVDSAGSKRGRASMEQDSGDEVEMQARRPKRRRRRQRRAGQTERASFLDPDVSFYYQNGPPLKRELKDAADGPPDFSTNPVHHANPPVPAAATTPQDHLVAGSGSKRSSNEKVPGGQSAPEALVGDGDSKAYQQTALDLSQAHAETDAAFNLSKPTEGKPATTAVTAQEVALPPKPSPSTSVPTTSIIKAPGAAPGQDCAPAPTRTAVKNTSTLPETGEPLPIKAAEMPPRRTAFGDTARVHITVGQTVPVSIPPAKSEDPPAAETLRGSTTRFGSIRDTAQTAEAKPLHTDVTTALKVSETAPTNISTLPDAPPETAPVPHSKFEPGASAPKAARPSKLKPAATTTGTVAPTTVTMILKDGDAAPLPAKQEVDAFTAAPPSKVHPAVMASETILLSLKSATTAFETAAPPPLQSAHMASNAVPSSMFVRASEGPVLRKDEHRLGDQTGSARSAPSKEQTERNEETDSLTEGLLGKLTLGIDTPTLSDKDGAKNAKQVHECGAPEVGEKTSEEKAEGEPEGEAATGDQRKGDCNTLKVDKEGASCVVRVSADLTENEPSHKSTLLKEDETIALDEKTAKAGDQDVSQQGKEQSTKRRLTFLETIPETTSLDGQIDTEVARSRPSPHSPLYEAVDDWLGGLTIDDAFLAGSSEEDNPLSLPDPPL